MLAAGKKFYDALRRVVAEESRVVPSSLFGNSRTARKQSFLILLKCRLNIITMRTKRPRSSILDPFESLAPATETLF